MRLISRGRLRDYWQQPRNRDSETPLKTWANVVEAAQWASHSDVKAAYGARVDLAYGLYVFNIGGNKHRLICWIDFVRHNVFARWVGNHDEYDDLCANDGKLLRQLQIEGSRT